MKHILIFLRFLDISFKLAVWACIILFLALGVMMLKVDRDFTSAKAAGDKAFWECHNPGDPELHLPTCKFDSED